MKMIVLGAGAGGGFPQWNCNGPLSRAAWHGAPDVRHRTQASLAVSADGEQWVLLNASPDLRQQIIATPALQPRADGPLRNSPIRAVVLTGADVDQVTGLLTLRERQAFTVYGSARVLATLGANSIFNVLDPSCVDRIELPLGRSCSLTDHGADLGLTVTPFAVPGKIALYLEDASAGASLGTAEGDTFGLEIVDRHGHRVIYAPSCAGPSDELVRRMRGASAVFLDGTLYRDDELITQGLLAKTGKRMGHISMSGNDGSLAQFSSIPCGRRIYIHINNSNPVLREGSPENEQVRSAGWEIAYDGMEIDL
jgi:pyrroloquinoline quinone biosynthesis protein B